jgi:hypothetical protein
VTAIQMKQVLLARRMVVTAPSAPSELLTPAWHFPPSVLHTITVLRGFCPSLGEKREGQAWRTLREWPPPRLLRASMQQAGLSSPTSPC